MKKIKTLFLIHDLGHGGAEKVLVNLVNNMDCKKFEVTVVALFAGGINEQFLKPHINYKTVFSKTFPGNSKIMKIFSPKQLHKMVIRENYDIEISYLEGPCARIISGCTNENTKLICWIHGAQRTREVVAKSFRNYKESKNCYAKFAKIVCVSEAVKKDFGSLYNNSSCVNVLYNTNETDQIAVKKKESVEEKLFDKEAFFLCGVGRIIPLKRFDMLARIHKRLKEDGYSVHTFLLGDGPEKGKIKSYVEENQIQDSFTFLGYQTNPYKYISRCDIFVCTSDTEGFSTAATEALVLGVPVITTPVEGMEEMLGKHNEYGIISEMSEDSLYENIKEMLSNREKLEFYKKQAQIRGKFFAKENTVRAVEDMLLRL